MLNDNEIFAYVEADRKFYPPTDWKSFIIDTNELAGAVDLSMREKIIESDFPLTPDNLAKLGLDDYARFHPVPDIPLVWSTNGVPSYPEKVVVAPLGGPTVGKNTLISGVKEMYPDLVYKVRTHTTREIQPRDIKTDYYFTTPDRISKQCKDNRLIEGVLQDKNFYATSIREMMRALNGPHPVVLWSGDIIGLEPMRQFLWKIGVPLVSIGIVAPLTGKDTIYRIKEKRTDFKWRIEKFFLEMTEFGQQKTGVDFFFSNEMKFDAEGNPDPSVSIHQFGDLLLRLSGIADVSPEYTLPTNRDIECSWIEASEIGLSVAHW